MGTDTDGEGNRGRRCKNRSFGGQRSQIGRWRMRTKWGEGRCLSPGRCTQFVVVGERRCRSCCNGLGSSAQF